MAGISNLSHTVALFLLISSGGSPAVQGHGMAAAYSLPKSLISAVQDTTNVQQQKTAKKKQRSTGKQEAKTSKVLLKRNVKSASLVKKKGGENLIEVVVMDSGVPLRNLLDLQMTGSSGSTESLSNYQAFRNVSLPFEGYIKFKSANKMGTVVYDREVRFTITEAGKWQLRIDV
ncbi:MAG TPA: hypothetical protein VIG72_02835 [Pontibacter sp.]